MLITSFDEEIVPTYKVSDLDLDFLKVQFKKETNKSVSTEQLINLKILKLVNKKVHPTVASILLCGKKPFNEFCNIECAHFKDNKMAVIIDRKEFSGSVLFQVEDVINFLKSHLPLRSQIKALKREEEYEIPIPILREAIVNAIVHRDYSMSGSNIKVAVFSDRIEITSPGSLPKGIDLSEIATGRSEIRNRVIARVFKELKYIEQWVKCDTIN